MALNSTTLHGESNSSKAQLTLNTTQLSGHDLSEYLSICEEVERLRRSQHQRQSYNKSVKATMTREEIFECSTLNDDEFLSALEHQNSYMPVSTVTEKHDLSQSIENILKYFDEDVSISSKSNRSTPTNFATLGKVAAVVANFKRRTAMAATESNIIQKIENPPKQCNNFKELKQKFESSTKTPSKVKAMDKVKTPPVLKAPTLVAAVKLKSAAQLATDAKPKTASPKFLRKSKVKQIAQMFNTKISQLVHRNPAEVGHYAPLNNEYSPDPKTQLSRSASSPATPPVPKPRKKIEYSRSVVQSPKPVPRNKPPTYCTSGRSPLPSPSLRRRQMKSKPSSTYLVAEDAFSQLSVKDKVLLYSKFIDDMTQKNPKFSKHAELIEDNVKRRFARGEVVTEKQESVRHLAEELEAKCTFPKQTISPKAIMRMQSINDDTFVTKVNDESQKESDTFFRAECAEVIDDDADDIEENPLHVSTLTVVLKPSPERKKHNSPNARPKPLPRKKRQQRLLHHLSLIEPIQKRSNDSIRSSHLSTELYAPPKKIRRTRSERLTPQQFFQNEDLELLFFSWIKEKNGVDFDIAHSDNELKTVKIVQIEDEEEVKSTSCTSELTQKSAVERLLEEAIAKLETTNISGKETTAIEDKQVETITVEDTKLLEEPQATSSPITNPVKPEATKKKPRRKPKAPAPPVPSIKYEDQGTNSSSGPLSTMSSAKQSDAESETATLTLTNAPAPPPRPKQPLLSVSSGSALSSAKQSDVESESGVSTLPKVHSDESQPEQSKQSNVQEFEFIKPLKPPRKKKMRRTLTWKNENSIIESSQGLPLTTTTDSDSDCKVKTIKNSPPTPHPSKFKQRGNHIKKLCFKTLKAVPMMRTHATPKPTKSAKIKDHALSALNKKFLRVMNSPRRIKSAYTLTILSSPSPNADSDESENKNQQQAGRKTSRSWPSALETVDTNSNPPSMDERPASADIQKGKRLSEQRPLSDSYIDQGFETGSNSIDSPVRLSKQQQQRSLLKDQSAAPLFFRLNAEVERSSLSRRSSYGLRSLYNTKSNMENPSNYSTPVKGHRQKAFISPSMAGQQQVFSPIQTPYKPLRRSMYEMDPRRSSSAMQVIQEDHPYEPKSTPPFTPDSLNSRDSLFFANGPTLEMNSSVSDFIEQQNRQQERLQQQQQQQAKSTYWITVGEFTVSIEVYYNTQDRLRLLYEIFSQKNIDSKDLHFGVDDHKFTLYNPKDKFMPISSPPAKESSHYWFSTGDLAVPFSGKYMPGKKVRRLFHFIFANREPGTILRFGVDNFEFTHQRERSSNNNKLSLDSNYSLLVGLQSGTSNGLEGRSKFAWPNPLCHILNANTAKTSDLDQSESDSVSLASADMRRQSYSPFYNTSMSLHSTPRNSGSSPDMYTAPIYQNETLAQVYKDAEQYNLGKSQTEKMSSSKTLTVPELLGVLQEQQSKLKSVEKRIRSYSKHMNLSNAAFDQCKDSPEYIRKLRNIIKVIDNIGRDNGFKACSLKQLENFMFFLSRYAEICLTKCSDHMNQILDALMEQRPNET